MSFQGLASKWRPQRFEDVVGQDHITQTLRNSVAAGRVGQRYLFTGPPGTGKTTTARILAKAINCEDRTGPEPCGDCERCTATYFDVEEIDCALYRGIDSIRDLRSRIYFVPMAARFRVYILDEVHQLTTDAFSGLLKPLEEPPKHAVFVLATTDTRTKGSDIPETVLSRVQRFDFRPIAPEVILARLQHILTEEKIPFESRDLEPIVSRAKGSVRDALMLLDTAIAYGNGQVKAQGDGRSELAAGIRERLQRPLTEKKKRRDA